EKIFFESFSKASKTAPQTIATNETLSSAEIVFARSGKTLTWQKGDGTILEFAEANGIDPPYSCRQGICLTCMRAIAEGEVEYLEAPTGTPDEGSVLICISQPKTPRVVLDL
nr:2Fe-2S iron-sulfur cluster binding domain-containing protein [Hydrococcus sp. Prado102]